MRLRFLTLIIVDVLRRGDRTEKTVGLAVGTGCEIKRVGARFRATAEGQGPQTVDGDPLAVRVPELAQEIPVGVEHVDPAVTEIADEDVAAEPAKGLGCPCDAPGRVQSTARGEAPEQMAFGVEDIDKAAALAGVVVVLCRVLLGVGHEQIAIDVLDAERSIAERDIRIGKVSVGGYWDIKAGGATGGGGAVHFDRPGAEVGDIEQDEVGHVGGSDGDAGGVDAGGETLVNGAYREVGV